MKKKVLEKQHEALGREFEIAFGADQDAQEHLQSLTELMSAMNTLTWQELTD
jgi:predicted ArsR family transcriptional regulator